MVTIGGTDHRTSKVSLRIHTPYENLTHKPTILKNSFFGHLTDIGQTSSLNMKGFIFGGNLLKPFSEILGNTKQKPYVNTWPDFRETRDRN